MIWELDICILRHQFKGHSIVYGINIYRLRQHRARSGPRHVVDGVDDTLTTGSSCVIYAEFLLELISVVGDIAATVRSTLRVFCWICRTCQVSWFSVDISAFIYRVISTPALELKPLSIESRLSRIPGSCCCTNCERDTVTNHTLEDDRNRACFSFGSRSAISACPDPASSRICHLVETLQERFRSSYEHFQPDAQSGSSHMEGKFVLGFEGHLGSLRSFRDASRGYLGNRNRDGSKLSVFSRRKLGRGTRSKPAHGAVFTEQCWQVLPHTSQESGYRFCRGHERNRRQFRCGRGVHFDAMFRARYGRCHVRSEKSSKAGKSVVTDQRTLATSVDSP